MKNYLFVCSRATHDIAKAKGVIGFYDIINTLNNEFGKMKKGDRIFFYVTKEKIIDGFGSVSREIFYDNSKLYENMDDLCVRRMGVEFMNANRADFVPLVDKLSFIVKKKGVVWSAYLVKNLIPLNDADAKTLEDALAG